MISAHVYWFLLIKSILGLIHWEIKFFQQKQKKLFLVAQLEVYFIAHSISTYQNIFHSCIFLATSIIVVIRMNFVVLVKLA